MFFRARPTAAPRFVDALKREHAGATVVDSYSYRFRTVLPIEAVLDRPETPHGVNLFGWQ